MADQPWVTRQYSSSLSGHTLTVDTEHQQGAQCCSKVLQRRVVGIIRGSKIMRGAGSIGVAGNMVSAHIKVGGGTIVGTERKEHDGSIQYVWNKGGRKNALTIWKKGAGIMRRKQAGSLR